MIKTILLAAIILLVLLFFFARKGKKVEEWPDQAPVGHALWDQLLKKHVRPDGFVDYKGFVNDTTQLDEYLRQLSSTHPRPSWTREEQMAYWINAYNAFTIKLIVDHYPVESIKEIKRGIPFVNSVWDIKFIRIEAYLYDLNNIEHHILRKTFRDARIHAAINCASVSCPRLLDEAYVAPKLNDQLEEAMRLFVNDPLRNRVRANRAELSQIFSWFGGDFRKDAGSVKDFINRYAAVKLEEGGRIDYIDYDWGLNEVK